MNITPRQESARLCADRLYQDPVRAEFRVNRTLTADPQAEVEDTLSLIAVYDASGHRATPLPVTLDQRLYWTRALERHAYAVARGSNADLTDELAGFSVQLA